MGTDMFAEDMTIYVTASKQLSTDLQYYLSWGCQFLYLFLRKVGESFPESDVTESYYVYPS